VSLIHILLALRHEVIPAQRRFVEPPPSWHLEDSPLTIPLVDVPWPARLGAPRTAAISGFGFGGTNAHLIVREHKESLASRCAQWLGDDPAVLVGWTAHLPGDPTDDQVHDWMFGEAPAFPVSFGDHPALPPFTHVRIPPATLRTIDRCQLMALRCVLRLQPQLGTLWERHRDSTGVLAGHLGPTRNATLYALRTYLRDLEACIDQDSELSPLQPAFPGFAEEVRALVPATCEDSSPGIMPNVIPARVANYFDLHGLNMTVDTGVDSTISAVTVAARYLCAGDLDLALVLGINGNSTPELRTIAAPLLGEDTPELAEGAFLLALTRRSIADRERLPVLAEIRVDQPATHAGTPLTHFGVPGRSYLAGDSAIAIIKASMASEATTITCRDAITQRSRTIAVIPASAVERELAPSADTVSAPSANAEPAPFTGLAQKPDAAPAVPSTVVPHVLILQDSPAVPMRPGTPAIPDECLLVTNAPELLADTRCQRMS
jgi:hypothetical protein